MILPATIDQHTEFNLIATAVTIYYRQSGCLDSIDTALLVADAIFAANGRPSASTGC